MSEVQCCVWEFRMNQDSIQAQDLIKVLNQLAKKWVFQLERGEKTGYMHYQGRMSLIKKAFIHQIIKLWQGISDIPPPNFLEPTVNPPKAFDYNCYASKADSRVGETYTDKDKAVQPIFVPRQYQDKMDRLRPFQRVIFDSAKEYDDRTINMIYCETGNNGKTTIAALCELFGNGIDLPPVNDAEKLIATCCDICMAKQVRDPSPIFVDLPRAMYKDKLNGIYTAIEQIKKGKLFDLRYSYKEWWIHSPQVWVFSNMEPDMTLLSSDRWKVYTINEHYELVPYKKDIFDEFQEL